MRLLFVSHSFPPADRPLSNVGGMQRVATELHDALAAHPGVDLSSLVLRSSWRWTHVKVVPYLARALWEIERALVRQEVDAVLFTGGSTWGLDAAAGVVHRLSEERRGSADDGVVEAGAEDMGRGAAGATPTHTPATPPNPLTPSPVIPPPDPRPPRPLPWNEPSLKPWPSSTWTRCTGWRCT